ncbi:MAG: extracellular solute-binding protein [Clostridia bacterium]|nr:extracellular solute-binding protein [Clostridia bacterium]
MNQLKRYVSTVLVACFCLSVFAGISVRAEGQSLSDNLSGTYSASVSTYEQYLAEISDKDALTEEIKLDLSTAELSGEGVAKTDGGIEWRQSGNKATFRFSVKTAGNANINVIYSNISEINVNKITFDVYLDGEQLFNTMAGVVFPRWFESSEITQDERGNDISEELTVNKADMEERVYASDLYQPDPMLLYFSAGEHTLTFVGDNTDVLIKEITVCPPEKPDNYEDVLKKHQNNGVKIVEDYFDKIQGENTYLVSSQNLIAGMDRGDSSSEPNDYYALKLNMIGGSTWKSNRETVKWMVNADREGLYRLTFKSRQNQKDGFISSRRLRINGEIPFEECRSITFSYNTDWEMKTLGDSEGNPYYFYLREGENIISLETVPGELSEFAYEVDEIVLSLNKVYRQIIMVVGTNIDKYRDYDLFKEIPGIEEIFKENLARVKEVRRKIGEAGVQTGSEMVVFDSVITLLELFLADDENIPSRVETLNSYAADLATWSFETVEQPLAIDYFLFTGKENELPKANAGFFKNLKYEFLKLLASFQSDYGVVGDLSDSEDKLLVWVGSGSEQMSILKNMASSEFTAKTGIEVEVALAGTSVSRALMADKAPDVALQQAGDLPMDLGYRNSAIDLTQFEDFKEVEGWFMPGSLVPYMIGDACYGLPCTQSFEMLFVRTDVFESLGLKVPTTWDEFYAILPILQFNNFEIGLGGGSTTFSSLLKQNDLSLFKADRTGTDVASDLAATVCRQWTEFFTKYDFPLTLNFYNRFRSGEVPIGTSVYTLAAQLDTLAPEIRGMWAMYPMIGTVKEDGTVDNSQAPLGDGYGSTAVLLNEESKEQSWEFLKWFLSEDTQAEYGNKIEARLGVVDRVPTSNVAAFKRLGWSAETREVLLEQWSKQRPTVVVPGHYYVTRHLNNAFRAIVYSNENPTHTLKIYSQKIDREIKRKLQEFSIYQ